MSLCYDDPVSGLETTIPAIFAFAIPITILGEISRDGERDSTRGYRDAPDVGLTVEAPPRLRWIG